MCTTPNETCLRSFFLKVFFLPFFSGAAALVAAAGFAMKNPSLAVGCWSLAKAHIPTTIFPTTVLTSLTSLSSFGRLFLCADPCGYERWYVCADRGPASFDGAGNLDRSRFR